MRVTPSSTALSWARMGPGMVGPSRSRIVAIVKQWNEKAGVYTFSVKGNEVIVPVMREK
ncbi:hypothetical protein GCM10010967_14940 [Dyadobacter beijingensis]|uniref:Uncharacterized protein n=1 Tax=Dyadobacter beijingensis TaxID=365489 RepID=A0ABQ2HLQ4_9BACT|nr:hypothetical protein [Dyadobacter beijingensis]GGM84138.1 hypothetical protein GCM10010967_14940 [Dyadobacter beijingensis]